MQQNLLKYFAIKYFKIENQHITCCHILQIYFKLNAKIFLIKQIAFN